MTMRLQRPIYDMIEPGFLTSGERSLSRDPSSQLSTSDGTSVSKVHIRKVVRGVSTEADKLLNYLVRLYPLI